MKQEDLESLQILLLLVLDKKVSLKTIKEWTDTERAAVEKWASACYLRASDNNVRVPPKPACLAGARKGERKL